MIITLYNVNQQRNTYLSFRKCLFSKSLYFKAFLDDKLSLFLYCLLNDVNNTHIISNHTYLIDVDYFKKLEIVFVIIICIFLYIVYLFLFVTFIHI